MHEAGERRDWLGGQVGEPAAATFTELWSAVAKLAASCRCEPAKVGNSQPAADIHRTNGHAGNIAKRASAYLATLEPAISGCGGHDQTFQAARAMVWGFDLSRTEALEMLQVEFNPRCQPPWTEVELQHKVEDADTVPFDKPRGWLRDAPLPKSPRVAMNGKANGVHVGNGHAAKSDNADGNPEDKRDNEQSGTAGQHLTDVGNGRRVVARWGSDLRFCHVWRQFLVWAKDRWCIDETGMWSAWSKRHKPTFTCKLLPELSFSPKKVKTMRMPKRNQRY